MEWLQARERIAQRIRLGADLNSVRSSFRRVLAVDASINSDRYLYRSETGFVVSIGKNARISVPWSLIGACYSDLVSPQGYSRKTFVRRFPKQAADHPCHVHVIGQMFLSAGLARRDGGVYRLNVPDPRGEQKHGAVPANPASALVRTPDCLPQTAEQAFGDVRGKLKYTGDLTEPTTHEWNEV